MTGGDSRRTIADQSVAQMGGRTSILARQRADHERLDRLMDRARETRGQGGAAHAKALRAVARLVFTHAFAEEAVLFPAARKVLPEGDPLTLHIESAHQEVDELVSRLDRSSERDPGHDELLERTFAVLDEDVRSEEDELLPRLQELLSPRQLRVLGWQWELVRRISPTRAHPEFDADLAWLLEGLGAAGLDEPVVVDLSRPEIGVAVVRVVAPGLEGPDDHPSYAPGRRARALDAAAGRA